MCRGGLCARVMCRGYVPAMVYMPRLCAVVGCVPGLQGYVPWSLFVLGLCALVGYVPWRVMYRGGLCARVVYVPWWVMCRWSYVPWWAVCRGYVPRLCAMVGCVPRLSPANLAHNLHISTFSVFYENGAKHSVKVMYKVLAHKWHITQLHNFKK